jgi:ABC-2 type transport system permease protein
VPIAVSLGLTLGFLTVCVVTITVIFRTGWRLRD